MDHFEQIYQSLIQRIASARTRQKTVSITSGFFVSSAISLILVLLAILLEHTFRFPPNQRIVFVFAVSISIFLLWLANVAHPILSLLFQKRKPSDANLAKNIGDTFHVIGDRLVNAIQVFQLKSRGELGLSNDLINQSIQDVQGAASEIDFAEAISPAPIKRSARYFSAAAILFAFSFIIFYGDFHQSGIRLMNPTIDFKSSAGFEIVVAPGNVQVLKNEPIELLAWVKGNIPEKMTLALRGAHEEQVMNHELRPDAENQFRYQIDHVQDSTEYFFEEADVRSSTYLISVVELPLVRYLQIKVTPPRYSQLPEKLMEENLGDINCLKGSRIELSLHSNKALAKAWIQFDDQTQAQLDVRSSRATGIFTVIHDGSYTIQLIDQFEMANKDPIEYRISVIDDIFPSVVISSPGQDVDITEEMMLPLTIEAEDDFGFTRMNLAYQLIKQDVVNFDSSVHYVPIQFDAQSHEKIVQSYNWNLSSFHLFPGDMVRYYVEVYDNDNISGPKKAKSATYTARFPTLEEIFTEVNSEQAETYEGFEGVYEKSKELKQNIDKIVEQVKQNPEMKWEEKKQVDELVEKQKQLEQSLEEVQQKLDQMIERMERNDLLGMETMQKYQELQELMNELFSDELKEAIKKLQEASRNVNPQELMQAIEQLNFTQEDFLQNIGKTLNILKRLQIEQKLDELVKTAENLLEKQSQLNKTMEENATHKQRQDLAQSQEEVENQTGKMLEDMKQLNETMEEFEEMPADKLEAAMEQMDRQELVNKMQSARSQLKTGKMQDARNSGKMAQNALEELSDLLKAAKSDLIDAQKQQTMAELQRLSHDILSLSKQQETLLNQSKNLNRNSPQINEAAERQQNLLNALSRTTNKMAKLSQKTFFVTQKLGRAMGQSMRQMESALSDMEQRNIPQANGAQQKSMMSLNEAIKETMNSMNNLANSKSSTGFDEFMEQLSQMAGKQQGINNQTMQLGMGQQMTMSQQALMARLAAEQTALQRSLEQMASEFGEQSNILGRLDHLSKEMGEVVRDLQSKKVSQATVNRQQQILQRLLDAQRSVRKQDYSRKRKAETARHYSVRSPGAMDKNLGEKNIQLQRDLLKALKEGYSKDYQELIRKYFEALMEESLTDEKNK
ncbi:MAG: DUF4175 family protein [Candidatus Zhuqueibacterota bacterium]